jgi:hypothetical protein
LKMVGSEPGESSMGITDGGSDTAGNASISGLAEVCAWLRLQKSSTTAERTLTHIFHLLYTHTPRSVFLSGTASQIAARASRLPFLVIDGSVFA